VCGVITLSPANAPLHRMAWSKLGMLRAGTHVNVQVQHCAENTTTSTAPTMRQRTPSLGVRCRLVDAVLLAVVFSTLSYFHVDVALRACWRAGHVCRR